MTQTESSCCPFSNVGLSLRPYRSPDFSRKTSRPSPGQTWELLVKGGFSLKRRRCFVRGTRVPASSESRVVGRSFETSFTLVRFEVHLHPASADVEQNCEHFHVLTHHCCWIKAPSSMKSCAVCFLDQGMFRLYTFKIVYLNVNGWRPHSTKATENSRFWRRLYAPFDSSNGRGSKLFISPGKLWSDEVKDITMTAIAALVAALYSAYYWCRSTVITVVIVERMTRYYF